MSAITGIFYRDGRSVSSEQINKMNNCLSHRGPDGSRVWYNGSVAFGHQMLHNTQESLKEELPFEDSDSGLVITSDARIDNRTELALLLGLENVQDIPDSYFILKAYQKWGNKCPEKLLGDFAFAIWDPVKQQLFCARDHMGVKPFYYYQSDTSFFFATEIKAIMIFNNTKMDLNETKIALELKNAHTDKSYTYFDDIHNLPAAHYLKIKINKITQSCYWKLAPEMKLKFDSEEEYYENFLKIFTEAVNCRLRCVFPIGFDLSGGLDSSSIVCMAKKIIKISYPDQTLHTYSYLFDDFPESDEREYIEKIVKLGGINHKYIKSDDIGLLDNVDTILWYQDQPYTNSFLPIAWNSFKFMKGENIKILLVGYGGDTVISHGEKYFLELFFKLKFKTLVLELQASSKRGVIGMGVLFLNEVGFPLIFSFIPEFIKKCIHKIKRYSTSHDFLDPNFAQNIDITSVLDKFTFKQSLGPMVARKYHYHLINLAVIQDDFEMLDKASAAFFIEPRYPYYDKRLIEFCYSIPTEMKYKFGWDRYTQRVSMEGILPQEVQWRSGKANLKKFFRRNLFAFEQKNIELIFKNHNPILDSYVNWKSLLNVYDNYLGKHEIEYISVYYIWYIMLLSIWLDQLK